MMSEFYRIYSLIKSEYSSFNFKIYELKHKQGFKLDLILHYIKKSIPMKKPFKRLIRRMEMR